MAVRVIASACVAAVLWTGVVRAGPAEIAEGARIARDACAPCHAIGATGASPRAEAPPFRDLGAKYDVENLEEALAEGIVVGHPDMPEVKMSEHEVAAFVAWLKTIQTTPRAAP